MTRLAVDLGVLTCPERAIDLSPADWNRLLPVLRANALTARLASDLAGARLSRRLPPAVRRQFAADLYLARQHQTVIRNEIAAVHTALADAGIPFLLLKGAGYLASGVDAGRGRLFEDIDVLVRPERLDRAEAALLRGGWAAERLAAYDERYYREWMHQVPPLIHVHRQSVVDLHHGLVPRTSRLRVDAEALWAHARPVPGLAQAYVPHPADLLLHAAVHALTQEDVSSALRDLVDMHRLLREFADDRVFRDRLARHGANADAGATLALARDLLDTVLGASPPPAVTHVIPPGGRGHTVRLRVMRRAIRPEAHPSLLQRGARLVVFLRGHFLKMPVGLLLRHIWMKLARGGANRDRGAGDTARV